jgi:hypothetical protein
MPGFGIRGGGGVTEAFSDVIRGEVGCRCRLRHRHCRRHEYFLARFMKNRIKKIPEKMAWMVCDVV